MTPYLFLFGRTPLLSLAELRSIFPSSQLLAPEVGLVAAKDVETMTQPAGLERKAAAISLLSRLGGTVKIASECGTCSEVGPQLLARIVGETHERRITFGVSVYGGHLGVRELLADTKKLLETKGASVRFVLPGDGDTLSSVVIEKEQVMDIVMVWHEGTWTLGKTLAVQDFSSWNRRDYGRPYSDAKSGMLPPKVARMAVNIAVGSLAPGSVILDPFCGMGTIVTEAVLCGMQAIGSDIAPDIVEKAKQNVAWVTRGEGLSAQFYISDAVHISRCVTGTRVDAVVTEPFLGTPALGENRVSGEKVRNIVKGLEKLYIGCLKDWHAILAPGGKIVIALPSYVTKDGELFVKKVVDTCENLGYNKFLGPIEYSRPQAIVRRQFFVFTKREP